MEEELCFRSMSTLQVVEYAMTLGLFHLRHPCTNGFLGVLH